MRLHDPRLPRGRDFRSRQDFSAKGKMPGFVAFSLLNRDPIQRDPLGLLDHAAYTMYKNLLILVRVPGTHDNLIRNPHERT
jgi:hypothetical protein